MRKTGRKARLRKEKKRLARLALRTFSKIEVFISQEKEDDLITMQIFWKILARIRRKPNQIGVDLGRLWKVAGLLAERFEADLKRLRALPFTPDRFDAYVRWLQLLAQAQNLSLDEFISLEDRKALRLQKQSDCARDALCLLYSDRLRFTKTFDTYLKVIGRYLGSARIPLAQLKPGASWEELGRLRIKVFEREQSMQESIFV